MLPADLPAGPSEDPLRHHGDAEVGDGLVDLAVNVRAGTPPAWLRERLAASLTSLGAYPRVDAARAAVALHHGRTGNEVLLTAGAAEAFVLIARALSFRHAVVVHPQFTEPEAALLAAGHAVDRVVLPPPFVLDASLVPAAADLVVVGNPTNPTSVLHPAQVLRSLLRPGRVVVVDEAFMDCVRGESESLADLTTPGLLIIRSLTKTWGLAGLRVGYVLGCAELIAKLAAAQPLWAVSTPALAACEAVLAPDAQAEVEVWCKDLAAERDVLAASLAALPGIDVVPDAAASFVLMFHPRAADLRLALRTRGFAVRRGDTFPGLGPSWLRIAVRDEPTTAALVEAMRDCLAEL